ncbi:glycosyl hydrolase [Parapedobacter pyrenivorans]|uniref:Glycosyl hydrolase n=2 Tax=Parapedobacter pyrenivorans TaxID=1305674 RepID=A0A917M654_9SPHI|nr:glycosyl hydrolase [Parapedobacter pyrenivorans]
MAAALTFAMSTPVLAGQLPANAESDLLFNGHNLTGWTNVNTAKDTWIVEENAIYCSGSPTGYLRTDDMYENYILDFEWFSVNGQDLPELLIHSDALPAVGSPFPRGIKGPTLRAGLAATGSASIKPRRFVGDIVLSGLWNTYRLECLGGTIVVSVNDKEIARGTAALPRKGHIAFAATGPSIAYRNIRLNRLPTHHPKANQIATAGTGWTTLFAGEQLENWDLKPGHIGHWVARDWLIDYDGKSEEKDKCLWSKASFRDFMLIADVRFTREPETMPAPVILPSGEPALNEDGSAKTVDLPYFGDTGIYLRGHSKNQINIGNRYIGSGEIYGYRVDTNLPAAVRAAVTPTTKADKPAGEWNRLIITMVGDYITVVLNDQVVIDHAVLPGIAAAGPIALQDDHWDDNRFQFANLFIKPLD